jgi:hypothetical protein
VLKEQRLVHGSDCTQIAKHPDLVKRSALQIKQKWCLLKRQERWKFSLEKYHAWTNDEESALSSKLPRQYGTNPLDEIIVKHPGFSGVEKHNATRKWRQMIVSQTRHNDGNPAESTKQTKVTEERTAQYQSALSIREVRNTHSPHKRKMHTSRERALDSADAVEESTLLPHPDSQHPMIGKTVDALEFGPPGVLGSTHAEPIDSEAVTKMATESCNGGRSLLPPSPDPATASASASASTKSELWSIIGNESYI